MEQLSRVTEGGGMAHKELSRVYCSSMHTSLRRGDPGFRPAGKAVGSTTALIAAKGLAAAPDVLGTSSIPAWCLTDFTRCTNYAACCRLDEFKPDSSLN